MKQTMQEIYDMDLDGSEVCAELCDKCAHDHNDFDGPCATCTVTPSNYEPED